MATKSVKTEVETKVEERLRELCAPFGLTPEITMANEDGVLIIEMKTGHDDLFISPSPDPLLAFQHLLRLIVRHDFPEAAVNLSLNAGGFHQRQRELLKQTAQDAANQVRATSTAVYLPPMSSFERRLVHLALTTETGVTSESTGAGAARRVVVKPERND